MRMVFIPLLIFIFVIFISPVWAYYHHGSKIGWYEYSGDAFKKAQEQGKPIFIYVTASWCFWCRAFEEDVLETEEVASYINQHYIAVFLDYDARPDLGGRYQRGGLPTLVFLAPNREPIASLTGYMSRENFLLVLNATLEYVREEWTPGEEETPGELPIPEVGVSVEKLRGYVADYDSLLGVSFDPLYGGFARYGGVVTWEEKYRFPQPFVLEYLLERGELEMVELTLDYMAGIKKDEVKREEIDYSEVLRLMEEPITQEWINRVEEINKKHPYVGIYDPVEGGFFRYATQRNWQMPRFEKMLDDNARLVRVYLGVYRLTGREEYLAVANRTLEYLLSVLYDGSHGFYGSQEAGELYYHLPAKLRSSAPKPGVDLRGYADRNAEMAATLFFAGEVLEDERLTALARRLTDWMLENMVSEKGALYFYDYRLGEASLDGLLRANVFIAMAGIRAYESTGEKRYLDAAVEVLDYCLRSLYDPELGGFYERNTTSMEYYPEEELFSPEKPLFMNALMTRTLLEAYGYVGKDAYLEAAEKTMGLILTLGLRSHELEHLAPAAESASLLLEIKAREGDGSAFVEKLRLLLLGVLAAGAAGLGIYKLRRRRT